MKSYKDIKTSQAEFLKAVHPETGWKEIEEELNKTGVKIHNFITYVETNWKT
ncbi:MAG: hypothetical protein Q7J86_05190 [Bacteroidota bacterium]|nr:hypothetical protein [Bacteroidota bacterium]MDO9613900.1 hypothetical protein [Bacteroidota bacterium]